MEIEGIDPTGKKRKLDVENFAAKNFTITVGFMGKMTAAVCDLNGVQGIGMAVCMPGDKYSKDIGSGIASARAIQNIAERMEQAWVERAVTKEEWAAKHKKG